MQRRRLGLPDWLLDALDPIEAGRILLRPRVRAALAWLAVSIAAVVALYGAWTGYNHPERPDGNAGHVYIDFAGQWLMGRMLVRGEGSRLYDREHLRQVLQEAYAPDDAKTLFDWLIESDDHPGVGGPLYPPIHGILFYPLGLLPPQPAYRVTQVVNLLLTFFIGFIAWKLTHGRVWASVAVGVLILFPGYNGAISLGQNSLLSLALLALGWLLISRNRPVLGGVVWGLLAFKPVWAASFFLVPLLMGRWRICAAMLLTGLGLGLLTLPFVGVQAWFDWLAVGRQAAAGYSRFETWIFLSRDLQGIPRRWLLDFTADGDAIDPDRPLPNLIGLSLWLTVTALTVLVALCCWQRRRPAELDGPSATFLMLGAWLSCYHFMYYDVLLAGLPVCLLFTDSRQRNPAVLSERAGGGVTPDDKTVTLARSASDGIPSLALRASDILSRQGDIRARRIWRFFPVALLILLIGLPHLCDWIDYLVGGGRQSFHYPPLDTFTLLALWMWCGGQWLRAPSSHTSPERKRPDPVACTPG